MGRWVHIEGAPAAERDRWEWLGDALLAEIAARLLLHRLAPSISSTHPAVADPLRLFRDAHDTMVCNRTLSNAYHAEDAPVAPGTHRGTREMKREADLVEAYIGKHYKDRRRLDPAMYDVMSAAMPEINRPQPYSDPRTNSFNPLDDEQRAEPAAEAAGNDKDALRKGLLEFYGGKLLGACMSLELFVSMGRNSNAAELTMARQHLTKTSTQLATFAAARESVALEALRLAVDPEEPLERTAETVASLLGHPVTGLWRAAPTTPARLPRCFERTSMLAQLVWPGTAKRVRDADGISGAAAKRAKREREARSPGVMSSIQRFHSKLSKKEQMALRRGADSEFLILMEELVLWFRAQQQPASPAEVAAMLRGELVDSAQPPQTALTELHALLDQGVPVEEGAENSWIQENEFQLPLTSSFHRLLTHSLCQYHGLHSQSASGGVVVSPSKAPPGASVPHTMPLQQLLVEMAKCN